MKYLIFSDESGKWNEGNYYVRSWVKITPEKYNFLRKEVLFAKHETKVKELKWEQFKKNYQIFKNIFNVDFSIFITISRPAHFQSRNYKIISEIEKVPVSTGGQDLTDKIKKKIVNSAKNELFFNYFEKTHVENSKKALVGGEDNGDYIYLIDSPQYLDKGWINIAEECNIRNIEVIKASESNPGIEVADVISGCVKDLLEKKKAINEIYNECIKPKMLDMTSKTFPNPNMIFYSDYTPEEKEQMDIFR